MKLTATALLAALSTTPVIAQENLPVFGIWDCGIMSFTLGANIYNISGKVVQVEDIEKISDNAYGATMQDGYRFAMFDVTATTLTWHSPASGDTFECRRDQTNG